MKKFVTKQQANLSRFRSNNSKSNASGEDSSSQSRSRGNLQQVGGIISRSQTVLP